MRMSYRQYKQHYSDCKARDYDRADGTIDVDIPYGRMKVSGTRGKKYDTYSLKATDGHTEQVEVPEPIHTYQVWKALGYQVRKGEKAIAKFMIWKYTEKKAKEGNTEAEEGDTVKNNMFMKMSAFFKASQCDRMEVKA